MQRESEVGTGAVVDPKAPPAAPKVVQSSRKPKATAEKPGPKEPKEPKLFDNMPLTKDEMDTFCAALCDLSELADTGLWHIGLDTDSSVPDRQGNPGVPIWTFTMPEARMVADSFVALGKMRPEVYKAMRAVTNSHAHLKAGLIVGSRFATTAIRLFEVGLNFRMSKAAWTRSIQEATKGDNQ